MNFSQFILAQATQSGIAPGGFALSDIAMFAQVVNIIVTVILAIFVSRIRGLETELKTATQQIVEQKLGLVQHRVSTIEARLATGDGQIAALHDRDHELRVEVLRAIGELKDIVATKDDLHRLREEIKK